MRASKQDSFPTSCCYCESSLKTNRSKTAAGSPFFCCCCFFFFFFFYYFFFFFQCQELGSDTSKLLLNWVSPAPSKTPSSFHSKSSAVPVLISHLNTTTTFLENKNLQAIFTPSNLLAIHHCQLLVLLLFFG
jgi:hypothetical protein